MRTQRTTVEYLQQTSDAGLESFQLARLDRTANLRKELTQMVTEMVDSEVEARLARWLLDRRRLQAGGAPRVDVSIELPTGDWPRECLLLEGSPQNGGVCAVAPAETSDISGQVAPSPGETEIPALCAASSCGSAEKSPALFEQIALFSSASPAFPPEASVSSAGSGDGVLLASPPGTSLHVSHHFLTTSYAENDHGINASGPPETSAAVAGKHSRISGVQLVRAQRLARFTRVTPLARLSTSRSSNILTFPRAHASQVSTPCPAQETAVPSCDLCACPLPQQSRNLPATVLHLLTARAASQSSR